MNAILSSMEFFSGLVGVVVLAFLLVLAILWLIMPFILSSGLTKIHTELVALRQLAQHAEAARASRAAEAQRLAVVYGKSMENHLGIIHQALAPEAYEERETF